MSHGEYEKILRKVEKSLLAAKKLLDENLPEFAVSRAYYTMFYCVDVPRKYLTYVNLAFRARQVADYSFELEVSEEEAAEEIRRAEEFLEFTRYYLSSKGFLEG